MKPVPHADELVIAAFFSEGLHDIGYDEILSAWNRGCYELIQEVTAYAPYLNGLLQAADAVSGDDRCGVFDYEVSAPFGAWFGQYVLDHPETAPPESEARAQLIDLVAAYFAQTGNQEQRQRDQARALVALREFDRTYSGLPQKEGAQALRESEPDTGIAPSR